MALFAWSEHKRWLGSASHGNCRLSRLKPEVGHSACLFWIKSAVLTLCRSLPVYPDQRTSSAPVGTSQRCQGAVIRWNGDDGRKA